MLFITHNAGVLAALADNIVVMREGEAVARGTIDKLRASPDEYVQGILFPERSLSNAVRKADAIDSAAAVGSSRAEQEVCPETHAVPQTVCRAVA